MFCFLFAVCAFENKGNLFLSYNKQCDGEVEKDVFGRIYLFAAASCEKAVEVEIAPLSVRG